MKVIDIQFDCGECLWTGNCGGATCSPNGGLRSLLHRMRNVTKSLLSPTANEITFSMDRRQAAVLNKWQDVHSKTCKFMDPMNCGAIGGSLSVVFCSTSLGQICRAYCTCGRGVDLTFYMEW